MITVGFKAGSKGLGLGFGCEGETREGEIWNPDITFSNIDERLEKALGAFRKDFKGGIPSGNLGPIYGDYGSFLPVYCRLQGGRVREGFSDWMKTKKRSLRLIDRDFNNVCKESKVDDMDCLSVKDRHKYDIHPSKGRSRSITLSNIDERLEKVLGGRVSEGFSDWMKTKKRSLSLTDQDFISVCKKSKVDDMDPLSNGTVTHSLPSVHGSQNENGKNRLLVDDFMGANSLNTLKQNMNLSEKQNANHQSIAAASDALKEAVKLKDYADRIQKSGSISEGRSLSFEAALKYLHAASLLESCHGQSEMILQSMQTYRRAAELCAFRKDFKGGIPSGNLGPIYGDYGSFLPVYRRPQGGRVREGFSDWMKTKKRSLRLTDRDFNSVLSASAKNRHKYDIHLSKGRKCEASKSSKSSVSGSQNGTVTHSLPSVHGSQNENGKNRLLADDFKGANSLKTLKQNMNLSEKQNANQSIAAATNALKEAVKLKDYADRIQKSGSISEGMSLSFEAALKYLHAASLLESCHGQSEMILQSMQTYRRAAELCESCAHEYEKSKDMAAAALAYKCMEVAYMRIISSSHAGARKDRHELQRDFKIVPPGEISFLVWL
ncbi:CW-type zinc finger [Actinidia rufa]|uniref:CW-type zinc finger n=1 Tax=Actinidia rufa TaxID=165716 RepID=A0A7J0E4J7_9ERIC|nr:CW-type zinc finger [Actinidia rufa]